KPLHQAAFGGHLETIELLVNRSARLDIRDTSFQATPLGWAEHGGRTAVVEYLRAHSALQNFRSSSSKNTSERRSNSRGAADHEPLAVYPLPACARTSCCHVRPVRTLAGCS